MRKVVIDANALVSFFVERTLPSARVIDDCRWKHVLDIWPNPLLGDPRAIAQQFADPACNSSEAPAIGAVLFGSVARKTNTERSDSDLSLSPRKRLGNGRSKSSAATRERCRKRSGCPH